MKKYTIEQLQELLHEVNGYDGSFDNLDYREMESLNELEFEPLELLRMAHFGDFNWNDEMYLINVYGNLESCSEDYFTTELTDNKDEIVEHYNDLVESGDIEELF